MKYTKKMIMVPEVEYLTLLNMIKGNDPLKTEKAQLDAKIVKSLTDKNLSEEVKAKKYNWLFKQRRKLKTDIENKPQKVVIDNLTSIPNIPPYLGIGNEKKPIEEDEERQLLNNEKLSPLRRIKKTLRKITPKKRPSTSRTEEYSSNGTNGTSGSEIPTSDTEAFKSPQTEKASTSKLPKLISPKQVNNAAAYIWKNKDKFGIETTGEVKTNFNKAVKGSNYLDILKHLAGKVATPPKGSTFLIKQLNKDPDFQKFYKEQQTGKGKNKKKKLIVVKLKTIRTRKTQGLEREKFKAFKPQLWAKL